MAGKTKRMSTIKQMLRLHQQGVSNRKIAKQISIYKDTVNCYIQKLKLLDQGIEEFLEFEDPILDKLFSAGTPAYLQQRYDDFKR